MLPSRIFPYTPRDLLRMVFHPLSLPLRLAPPFVSLRGGLLTAVYIPLLFIEAPRPQSLPLSLRGVLRDVIPRLPLPALSVPLPLPTLVLRLLSQIPSTAFSTSRHRRKRSTASARRSAAVSGERKRPLRSATGDAGRKVDTFAGMWGGRVLDSATRCVPLNRGRDN